MKKIVCYGDSNTYGFNPKICLRFNEKTRWTGILKKLLANYYELVEEGLNNRKGFADNPDGLKYNGLKHLPSVLEKYDDVEILVLAVGVNDLQVFYDVTQEETERALQAMISMAQAKNINVILVPPVILKEAIFNSFFKSHFNQKSIEKSKEVQSLYQKVAQKMDCYYFDFNSFVEASDTDGLHYDAQAHEIIAERLYSFILENFVKSFH